MKAVQEAVKPQTPPIAPGPGKIVYLALTASAFFWGAGFSVSRYALREVTPLELLAGAALYGAATQLAWTALRGDWRKLSLPPRFFWLMIAIGLLSQNILNGLTNLGLAYTTATNAALIYGFSPVLIGLLAALFLGESFGRAKALGAIVGFAGVALIITQGRLENVQWHGVMVGNLWVLGGSVYWASYAIFTRRLTRSVPPEAFTFYILVLSAVLPATWEWVEEGHFCLVGLDLRTHLAMGFVGLCTGALAMNFWNWGLAHIEASRVGMFSFLEPVFAAMVAMIFLGEHLTWPTGLGSVLVLGGIYFSTGGLRARGKA